MPYDPTVPMVTLSGRGGLPTITERTMHGATEWTRRSPRRAGQAVALGLALSLALGALLLGPAASSRTAATTTADAPRAGTGERESEAALSVIVRSRPSSGAAVSSAIRASGGVVVRRLDVINGFSARVPAEGIETLRARPDVQSVTPDGSVRLSSSNKWKSDVDLGSFYMVAEGSGVHDAWSQSDQYGNKITGRGVGVALIDSGVVPVEGLTGSGKIVNGPDLSFESQDANLRHLDTFGHGTHMAGIIAGRDSKVKPGRENDSKYFVGVAPDATLVNVKVASTDGATDVSQVIAAIDWVVQHRNDPGLNIRVLNLSFGTDSSQSYLLDPLAYAAEVAWHRGIVVVASAGNDGSNAAVLDNPARDPYVIAVGAADHRGTEYRGDDVVADFSNRGNTQRRPDLVAPGRSIVSLRAPGSFIDMNHPEGRVAGVKDVRYFRGSGTSQATAVVSGAVALLLQQRPTLTPDQVKVLLTRSADRMFAVDPIAQGAGLLDVKGAFETATPLIRQVHERSTGTGSLELARGSEHVADPVQGTELRGEQDIFGRAWDGSRWRDAAWAGTSWSGGTWNNTMWAGSDWTGSSWTGRTWRAAEWAGANWSGSRWRDATWSSGTWTAAGWSGSRWRRATWTGSSWNSIAGREA